MNDKNSEEKPSLTAPEEEKPIVFPDGSLVFDHSDITIESCSATVKIAINHQEGFSYTIFLRDGMHRWNSDE